MKKFFSFIFKSLIFVFLFLFVISVIIFICAYAYSHKNNVPIANTISDFKAIGNEFIDFTFTNKTLISLSDIESIPSDNEIEASANIASTTFKYYYNQLDDNAKFIYNSLQKNIDNLKKENYTIDFSDKFNDLLHQSSGEYRLNKSFQSALDAFFYEHPELFYIDITKIALNIKCVSVGPIQTYTTKISPKDNKNYFHNAFSSKGEIEIAIKKVENIKNNFINKFKNSSDYNKILGIHDALANSLEYDSSSSLKNTHNIYGALVEKKVVCEGYAKAFKYLLDSFGFENILVSGTAVNSSNESESHMWNYVKINNLWYGVDVTWDDPIIVGGSTKNNVRQDFFLKGNRTFLQSHYPSGKISDTGMLFKIPTLSNTNYNK